MPEKDLNNYVALPYIWVLLLSMWGGVVSFAGKVKRGETRWLNIMELAGEIFTSGFVGCLTFLICESAGINPLLTAFFVGLSGHMGTRALFMFEKFMEKLAKKRLEALDDKLP
jgi:hypothetical protein